MHGIGGCPCRKRAHVHEIWYGKVGHEMPSIKKIQASVQKESSPNKSSNEPALFKKRAKPTKDSPKRKRAQGVVYKYIKFKYILILYNIIQSNFSNIS